MQADAVDAFNAVFNAVDAGGTVTQTAWRQRIGHEHKT
jgi:hypothetical protein